MDLGKRILELRTEKNMSQGDLADALGVSRQSVSKWETDSSVPELEKLLRMSDLFHVTLDVLVHGPESGMLSGKTNESTEIRQTGLPAGRIVGFVLLGIGLLLLIMMFIVTDPLSALIVSSPFLTTAVICIFVRRHTALWCGWTIFGILYVYFRYATGIRFWWIFNKWMYRQELTMHALIAWVMTITLAMLVIATFRALKKSDKPLDS